MWHAEKTLDAIKNYYPYNEQEQWDKERMISFLESNADAYERTNLIAHMTASAWIVNKARDKVLMVYHRLYDSWAWTGGHCDGDSDMLHVAMKEAMEETGIKSVKPVTEDIYSLEILTVDGHEKKGRYVPSHLHLNLTYLLEADENESLHICEAENSAVGWFALAKALEASSEPWFVKRIYSKLNQKLSFYS